MMKDKLARLKKVAERAQAAHREFEVRADDPHFTGRMEPFAEEFHDAMNAYHEDFTNVGDSVPTVLRLIEALETANEALDSIGAEPAKLFDERLSLFPRGRLISIIDTDTALARQARAKMEEVING